MPKFLFVGLFLFLSLSVRAQSFSIFDLYDIKTSLVKKNVTLNVVDPRKEDVSKMLKTARSYNPSKDDYDCSYKFHGNSLSFQKITALLGAEFAASLLETRAGSRLQTALKQSTFTVGEMDCGTHNYSSWALLVVDNELRFAVYVEEKD